MKSEIEIRKRLGQGKGFFWIHINPSIVDEWGMYDQLTAIVLGLADPVEL